MYVLIKYIKSVFWRVVKRLLYIEEARHLKVKCKCTSTNNVVFINTTLPARFGVPCTLHIPIIQICTNHILWHKLISMLFNNVYFLHIQAHDPGRGRHKQAHETASHVLCNCEALVTLRFRNLGQHFMKPGDFQDISVSRILHAFQKRGAAQCVSKRAPRKVNNSQTAQVTTMPSLILRSTHICIHILRNLRSKFFISHSISPQTGKGNCNVSEWLHEQTQSCYSLCVYN